MDGRRRVRCTYETRLGNPQKEAWRIIPFGNAGASEVAKTRKIAPATLLAEHGLGWDGMNSIGP
jgi:hypothetical protein